jgi:AcrR family transcriptional regulator
MRIVFLAAAGIKKEVLTLSITIGKLPMVMDEDTKTRLIAATLSAIEENKGCKAVSLRGIAKAAGCSHVNVYHYADGLDGLFWLAYVEALRDFTAQALAGVALRDGDRNFGQAAASGIVAFALEHEGLYRLLWFEDLSGEPPEAVRADIALASAAYRAEVAKALAEEGGAKDALAADQAADYFFAYLQGELSLLINGRLGPDRGVARAEVLARCRTVWTILVNARIAR